MLPSECWDCRLVWKRLDLMCCVVIVIADARPPPDPAPSPWSQFSGLGYKPTLQDEQVGTITPHPGRLKISFIEPPFNGEVNQRESSLFGDPFSCKVWVGSAPTKPPIHIREGEPRTPFLLCSLSPPSGVVLAQTRRSPQSKKLVSASLISGSVAAPTFNHTSWQGHK